MIITPTFLERLLHKLHLLPTPIVNVFSDVLFGRALAIAVRRGFFESLANGPQTIETISGDTGLDGRGLKLLADAFVIAGYVKSGGEKYGLSKEGSIWLLKDSPHYLGNLVAYFETLYNRWGYLEESLRYGRPPRPYFENFQDEDWRVYVYGMQDLARLMIRHVEPKLKLHPGAESILDVGGSHGLYSIVLARKYPQLRATVFDFPGVLKHTAEILEKEQLSHRVLLHSGDFMKEAFPSKHDGILLCNIIHGLSEKENGSLIRKCMEALKGGGKLFILDQFIERAPRSQFGRIIPLMVGLNLLNETGGMAYSIEQVRGWCTPAASLRYHRLRLPGVGLIEVQC